MAVEEERFKELTPQQAERMLAAPRCEKCQALVVASRPGCSQCGTPYRRFKCRTCEGMVSQKGFACPECQRAGAIAHAEGVARERASAFDPFTVLLVLCCSVFGFAYCLLLFTPISSHNELAWLHVTQAVFFLSAIGGLMKGAMVSALRHVERRRNYDAERHGREKGDGT